MLLFWCILVGTSLGVCLKLFPRWKVNAFHAIVINYTVCLTLGTLLNPPITFPFSPTVLNSTWFKYDILLGFLFISGFTMTAYTISKAGMTVTAMVQRMSIILSVSFTVIFFHERMNDLEICALMMALLAIATITQRSNSVSSSRTVSTTLFLLLILLLSAGIESLLFYVEKTGTIGDQQMAFTTHGFGCAAIIGWLIMGGLWLQGKARIKRQDLLAGILLGLPNYFSIYLLLLMLTQGWKGSILYPVLNVSILLTTTVIGLLIFKEKLNRFNWIGIGLATTSILIFAYGQNAAN